MDAGTYFLVAVQSGLVLGLIHGVNPCGHSWVVLAPFVAGEKSGWRVSLLTAAFITGTAAGCIAIAVALGALSTGLPESARYVVDCVTAGLIIILGAIMLVKPHVLHSHDHDHHHDHEDGGHTHHGATCSHDHDLDHDHHGACHHHGHHSHNGDLRRKTALGLGTIGFVNVIVPCPTLAMMYSYAIDAASIPRAVGVFGAYAVSTGVALAGVIFVIFKVTSMIRRLQQPWIEPLVMRTVGMMTMVFGAWSLYIDLA